MKSFIDATLKAIGLSMLITLAVIGCFFGFENFLHNMGFTDGRLKLWFDVLANTLLFLVLIVVAFTFWFLKED